MHSTSVSNPSKRYSEVTEVADPRVIEEICAFRVRVWQAAGGMIAEAFAKGSWRDAQDAEGRHWIVRDATGRLVAAARLTLHDTLAEVPEAEEYLRYGLSLRGPIAAPARVVVCPTTQGSGLGRLLLDAQDRAAQAAGAAYAVRQASPAMVRLLVPRIWRILGPATIDPRFPGVRFQVSVLDYAAARRTAA